MATAPISWLPDSPFRSPAWRWHRASWLVERGKRISPRHDDEWVRRAKRYMSSRRPDPVIQAALDLSREEHPHRRWQVEALLLTTESMEEIAARFDLHVDVVACYHELFFHVRPHLHAADWVMTQAVGRLWWHGFSDVPLGIVWKYFAFVGGPLALDLMVSITTDTPFTDSVRKSLGINQSYSESRLRIMGNLVVKAMTVNTDSAWKAIVSAHAQLQRLDRQQMGSFDESPNVLQLMERVAMGRKKRVRHKVREAALPEDKPFDLAGSKKAKQPLSSASLFEMLAASARRKI